MNTLFLLDAGLSFFEVFVANAAFSAGMVVFEIPTGVVADTLGRRVSFLLSVSVLGATTLLYVALAQVGAGVVAFALVSVGMGLGFMVGAVGGGLLGQIDLAIPYLVRATLLAVVFVVAFVVMHDLGFIPRRVCAGELPGEIVRNGKAGVEFGWGQRQLRLLMLASLVQVGFLTWGFYASQPYLLELLDSDAVWIAGLVAAGVALSTIAGNQVVSIASGYCGRRTTLLLAAAALQTCAAVALGVASSFWVALPAFLLVTASVGVTSPVRQAYLHQVVPTEQRATVVSFDSMVSNVGGVGGQVGLGALGEARTVGAAFVAGGVATAAALPLLAKLRRLGGAADLVVGERAGAESACAASGLPAVSAVETIVIDEPDLAAVAVRA